MGSWVVIELSCKPHPSQREEGSGHAATIELSPRQKLDVTNQIRALFVDHICCHGVQLCHNYVTIMSQLCHNVFNKCQLLIT